ncbi:hypothetical protein [Enterobacter hormaechei]|uniref:antirestriction phage head protein DarA n=1 Tax=Enterobacter hormaechei TaxID=158836 RepID=UPI0007B3AD9A|nr:hypothetical protein [Enterobacter hormaechei]KZP84568.1 hypothetical protein A3N47_10250 [Enterobacter hormaechei subsp. xiangfangensis]RTM57063.1 hypothetical protein EKO17_24410 [Enterobacter hormaechei subsp. xiangfangensis]
MLSNLRLADAITVRNRMDLNNYRIGDQIFDRLMTDGKQDLLFESWNMTDFEALYFYDTDFDKAGGLLLEAITTTRAKISQTMRAFMRSLNLGLEGTRISAGVTNVEDTAEGSRVIGGAEIGKARRSGNLALLPAQIPLSDGQTVTIVFHSPTGDTTKITSSDTLVAFRFFLNKRDVTHAVAPIGGRDMSLKQTTQILSNLIERNSEKFQRSRDKNARLAAEISEIEAADSELASQINVLIDQGDQLNASGAELDTEYEKYQKLADKQATINASLQKEIEKMKAQLPNRDSDKNPPAPDPVKPEIEDKTRQVTQNLQMSGQHTLSNGAVIQTNTADKNGELVGWVTITTPDGSVFKIDSPSSQGGAMQDTAKKLLKLYRDGKAEMYRENYMALNDEVKSIVDAALAVIKSANALSIESGAKAVDAAANQLLQKRYALEGALVLDQYLDQLNQADTHLTELQNELSKEGPGMPDGNAELTAALEAIQNAAALNDASLAEIKEHLKKLREAYAVLDGAGVLEEYQEMFDAASQHLGDLMQQIARG